MLLLAHLKLRSGPYRRSVFRSSGWNICPRVASHRPRVRTSDRLDSEPSNSASSSQKRIVSRLQDVPRFAVVFSFECGLILNYQSETTTSGERAPIVSIVFPFVLARGLYGRCRSFSSSTRLNILCLRSLFECLMFLYVVF